ncbi:MAG: DUF4065 domain-containing protein [Rhodobacteraceae bacterium]|nr:DUF4065 domain-containing protein [Paracoccaceae bacterium]
MTQDIHVKDVARYILDILFEKNGGSITAWKLQKLVYYCQAWSLVWDERLLFQEEIEAWADGPVCRALFDLHKGRMNLNPDDIAGNPSHLDDKARETIDAVLDFYGGKSGNYLRELTHMERPWKETRGETKPGYRSDKVIPPELMREYYAGL